MLTNINDVYPNEVTLLGSFVTVLANSPGDLPKHVSMWGRPVDNLGALAGGLGDADG